jgi:hypothetical protein
MIKLTKKYQLWVYHGYEGYELCEFDTLEECLTHERYGSDFTITQKVDWEVKEK